MELPKPEKLKDYKSKIDHQHARIEQLKAKYETMYYAHLNSRQIQTNMDIKKEKTTKELTQANKIQECIHDLEAEMKQIILELKSIKQKQCKLDEDFIAVPTYGTNDTPDFIALNSLPSFDPDEPNTNLFEVWQLIKEFAQSFNLSEKGIKTCLAAKLKGEALKTYLRLRTYSIRKILRILKDNFGSFPSIAQYEEEYNNFRRKSNEPITSAMSRFKHILMNLCRDEPKQFRHQTLAREGTRMLKMIAMPEALSMLEREEKKSDSTGTTMTFRAKLKLIQEEERILKKQQEKLEKPKTKKIPQTNHINYDNHETQPKEKIHPTTNNTYYDEWYNDDYEDQEDQDHQYPNERKIHPTTNNTYYDEWYNDDYEDQEDQDHQYPNERKIHPTTNNIYYDEEYNHGDDQDDYEEFYEEDDFNPQIHSMKYENDEDDEYKEEEDNDAYQRLTKQIKTIQARTHP